MRSSALILVHGVPDTAALWRPLKDRLPKREGPVVALSLPGFGSPLPAGFSCTKDAYADWLLAQVERIACNGVPVDIVGHDWGALLTTRAVSLRPKLFRSWVLSGAVVQKDYPGHTFASLWNTPVIGELMMAMPKAVAKRILMRQGMPPDLAAIESAAADRTMRSAILKLYRSAGGLARFPDWLPDVHRMPSKGMVIWGGKDPYVPPVYGQAFAKERSVPFHVAPAAGHWVVAQDPDFVAERLARFWGV
ncbi:oxidoreductase [Parvularcula lutaonensis]|nr:oxidoreductase [Parvularcula lutaonensis]